MSEESTEIALYSLPSAPAELESAFISDDYVDRLIESIRNKSKSVVGDLNTVKGRKVYISMAASVRSSKAAIDEAGKNLVAEMKKRPALVDASRRKIREALDELAIEIRKPVTEWEAEQERIKAEEQMIAWHTEALEMNEARDKALAERVESDHEIALLLNDKFDRDAAEAKAEAERQRIAREEEIKRQAIEQARIESEQKAQQEREASAKREADLKAAAEQAERNRIEAQERAEREAKEAKEKAEREKQQAIEAEQIKARQEADRIKREAEQKEATRLAEEKRIADEAAARAANEAHRKTIGTAVVNALIAHAGLTREDAIATLVALKGDLIPHTRITY